MNYNLVDILLVEDNADDAELTIRELTRHNMAKNLVHLKDGEEALEFIFCTGKYSKIRKMKYLPKLLLLDIQMPKINGIEVLEKIKGHPATKVIPVVMLTSSNESPDIKKCYNLGANSYIVKPVNYDTFSHAIKSIGTYWIKSNQPQQTS